MKDKIKKTRDEFIKKINEVKKLEVLESLERKIFGRKGELTLLLRGLANLSKEERRVVGKKANDLKKELKEQIKKAKERLIVRGGEGFVDVTLPGESLLQGHKHPIRLVMDDLQEIFSSLGFSIFTGPELESDFFNFTALNIPEHHPARDIQDTFYVLAEHKEYAEKLVMRTHTSPMQVRAMLKYGAPLRCVVPGRVFRCEATDAVHDTTFYQIEGLMVDKEISVANLIGLLKEVLSGILGQKVKLRVRPGYFPFVEPGLEVDIGCTICNGSGCPSCKHSGWLEMLGAGMVHPQVLEYGGINKDEYSGFAFGIGITRLAMMKYGINDIRMFNSGDLQFLHQF